MLIILLYCFQRCLCSVLILGLRESTTYTLTVFVVSETRGSDNITGVSVVVTTHPAEGWMKLSGFLKEINVKKTAV